MCNNVVALGSATSDGTVIFGKNSDRSPNEGHVLEQIPAADHPEGSLLRCTYVEIPQVSHTYAVMLARPCWTWGAEMGTNEHGLTIGNTAVYTKVPYQTGPGLLGMDLLRLALERAVTAREAVDVITNLLEIHGQGGNCGFRKSFYYHNSFLIADSASAWVVETAGPHWIAEQVEDVRATSNTLTITTKFDLISKDMISFAEKQGWYKSGKPFNFKESYGGKGLYPSFLWTVFGKGDQRQNRLTQLLDQHKGSITPYTVMSMLRDHGTSSGPNYTPADGYFANSVCMHTGFGPIRTDQTTGSMVTHFLPERPLHWLSGTAAPCTGIFKPVWFDAGLPDTGPSPTGQYNQASLWWQHERLHREILCDYQHRLSCFGPARDELETDFLSDAPDKQKLSAKKRLAYSQQCFQQAAELTSQWIPKLEAEPVKAPVPFLYRKAWDAVNKDAFLYLSQGAEYTTVP